jgi:hypothetical protein
VGKLVLPRTPCWIMYSFIWKTVEDFIVIVVCKCVYICMFMCVTLFYKNFPLNRKSLAVKEEVLCHVTYKCPVNAVQYHSIRTNSHDY